MFVAAFTKKKLALVLFFLFAITSINLALGNEGPTLLKKSENKI